MSPVEGQQKIIQKANMDVILSTIDQSFRYRVEIMRRATSKNYLFPHITKSCFHFLVLRHYCYTIRFFSLIGIQLPNEAGSTAP